MNTSELDRITIERVKAGESSAFKGLIDRHKDDAFSLACSVVKDRALAEDILQEVFIKVFDKLSSFKNQSSFSTWLYRIVVNKCYNELRRVKKLRREEVEISSDRENAAELVNQNDLKAVINYALDQMKPDEALILRLFYLSELKIDEVEEITGFTKSKVKVTLHRARKSLAEILKSRLGREIEDL